HNLVDVKRSGLADGAFNGDGPQRSLQCLGKFRRLLFGGAELVVVVVVRYVLEGRQLLAGAKRTLDRVVQPGALRRARRQKHSACQRQASQELAAVQIQV